MRNNTGVQTVPPLVKWMHENLIVAHLDLAEYKRIYTENEEDLEVLNSAGQLFFVRLHKLYWSSFIQTAGRLMDPAVSQGRDNASIGKLVEEASGLPFQKRITELKAEAYSIWTPLKSIRNRVVAHSDVIYALTPPDQELRAETTQIERIFMLAGECIKLFYIHYANGLQVTYGDALHPPGAERMLKYLKKGKAAMDAEKRAQHGLQVRTGSFPS
jgi:hypothetical protein